MKRNFLRENKSFFLFVIALIMGTVGGLLAHPEVVIAAAISFSIIVLLKMDNRKRCGVIKAILVAITILVAIIFHIFYCKHQKEDVNENLSDEITQQDDNTENTTEADNTSTVNTENTTPVSTKSSGRRPNITDEERAKSQDLNPIYGGGEGDNANKNGGAVAVDNSISTMEGQDGEESVEYQEEAKNAEEEEDIKVEQNNDSSYTLDDNTSEEEKAEVNNNEGSTDAGDENTSWSDIGNGENVTAYEPVKVEEDTAEDNKENTIVVEDNKEDTTVVEDNKEDTTVVEDNKEDTTVVEDNKEDTTVDNTTEKVKPVKVNSVDGYTATIGSTIQFNVEGDDLLIEGLEGYNYSINNGVLSIDTGDEATVLTVCISNSVNEVTFDININGIIG